MQKLWQHKRNLYLVLQSCTLPLNTYPCEGGRGVDKMFPFNK